MSEAFIWFVIPEFLLFLVIFMRIRRRIDLLLYDIYGTIVGTILAYIIHLRPAQIAHLPYIQPKMLNYVHGWYNAHGIFGLIFQPFSGVPYKVFTYLAPYYHFFILYFLVVAIVVRISRYFLIYLFLDNVYPFFHKFVYKRYVRLFFVSVFIFSVLLLKVYESYA
ncbi:MAG: hypothetical protein ACHQT9_02255 [Candidatus Saccharimonadales bacterium]